MTNTTDTTWNTDFTTAPRGKEITPTRKVKTKDGIVERDFVEVVPEPIWAATDCGLVIKSHWVDQKLTPSGAVLDNGGRWSGFSKGVEPVAWQPFIVPVHPFLENLAAEDAA